MPEEIMEDFFELDKEEQKAYWEIIGVSLYIKYETLFKKRGFGIEDLRQLKLLAEKENRQKAKKILKRFTKKGGNDND